MTQQFGLVGLGVMGQNLALNMERNGVSVVGYDRSEAARKRFAGVAEGKAIQAADSAADLVAALPQPRHILMMVPAGAPVDGVIAELQPLLAAGDLLIDGGNSFFVDTERRAKTLAANGISFMGLGVSGGEEGALWGPSMMAGGDAETYGRIKTLLQTMAAKAKDGAPCVALLGPRGAGHYVKMVHNGIEYGDMQLIAEAYDLLHRGAGVDVATLHNLFSEWNRGELASYLIEITADIFTHVDADTGQPLVDMILDKAGQKGTGKWTSQNALDVGTPIPTLMAAVNGRLLSAIKEERLAATAVFPQPSATFNGDAAALAADVRDALYASKVCAYAQGLALLRAASHEYSYGLDLATAARIWRAGCIIRADLLDHIATTFTQQPDLPNLLMDAEFRQALLAREAAWRRVITTAIELGIPMPAMMASLSYFDSYRSGRLPANLIQAQRDYFGAHTFARVDKPGTFHHDWSGKG
ncbi:MAG: NADP-dependent phosphogluconate dehydrogenase [Anaerolineales bacterium]|nr:NADP-dependent phosphogluconate dehydrogenase [Anaerolineales bacterium]